MIAKGWVAATPRRESGHLGLGPARGTAYTCRPYFGRLDSPMASTYNAGQTLRCTIERVPRTDDDQQTILRLMRKDPTISKRLRRSQMMRRRHMVVYNRGNRDWYKRETVGKVATMTQGAQ